MKNLILRTWLGVLLSFLGFSSPVAKATLPEPSLMLPALNTARVSHMNPSVKTASPKDFSGMKLHASERSYSYIFAGKAVLNGQPSAKTRILVQLTSPDKVLVSETVTDGTGSYSLTLTVTGEPTESIRWEISALTPEMKKASAEGHQILMEDSTIQQNTLLSVF